MLRNLFLTLLLTCLITATCMHVVKVDGLETIIKPFAGGGFGEFGSATNTLMYASAITATTNGDVYFADYYFCRVRRISNGTISSVAGSSCGFGGDGGLATDAAFSQCRSVAFGSNGDFYIADKGNNRIRKVSGGIITTIAGTGTAGSIGDGGPATNAQLNGPLAVEVSSLGEVYIADTGNHRIRKIALNGTISTVVGTGNPGYAGDNGPATSAVINSPKSVVIGPDGDLYIVDTNHRIRKVSGGIITTIAGTGTAGSIGDGGPATNAQLNTPNAVAFNSNGEMFITDTTTNKIRKISTNGTISAIAGSGAYGTLGDGGLAIYAELYNPTGAAVAPNGDFFFTDNSGSKVRKVDVNGNISVIAGNFGGFPFGNGGLATEASVTSPYSVVAHANGDIYISETTYSMIRKVSNGTITIIAGNGVSHFSGDGGLATSASLKTQRGVAVNSIGEIFIADTGNHRIRKISTDGKISTIAGTGTGGYANSNGLATNAQLKSPYGIALNANGEIYFCDFGNFAVRKFVIGGNISTIAGVLGTESDTGDGGFAISATFKGPSGIALGSNGEIYISDEKAQRIRKISTDGKISTIAGTGVDGFIGDDGPATSARLLNPQGIVLGPNGDIFFSDRGNHRIRKISASGNISTIAGTGSGYSGNGGHPLKAQLNQPNGITLDLQGNLYIADTLNNIVRVITTVESVCNGIVASNVGVCNGNGTCVRNEVCNCNPNYLGTYCEVPICFGKLANNTSVCNKNGKCAFVDTCQCNHGWIGSECSIPTCHGDVPSSPQVCSAVGKCVGADTCECFEGFKGSRCEIPLCFGTMANDTKNVCSGSGNCVSNNTCNCLDGFIGTTCEIPLCFGKLANDTNNVCSGLGKCISNNTCNCLDGWAGPICEIPICFGNLANAENVCSGHGSCVFSNSCKCYEGFTGSGCEIPLCFGNLANDTNNVCSGLGKCISNNTCNCLDGFSGQRCEIPICYGKLANDSENVCSGHGSCSSNNTCNCLVGWIGTTCETTFCFGKLANDTKNVCSGHGSCISNNTCNCLDGWKGPVCEIPICFGNLANAENVCSGHGSCVFTNSCQCYEGFTGPICEIPLCFGKLANDTNNVCSGLGKCISNNTCNCLEGWTGTTCETPLCFGQTANDTANVCSGHGQCVSNNTCQCNGGWTGDSCSVKTCFKIPENEKQVCSGRGKCDGIDTCNCTDGWAGLQCEHFTCFGLLPNSTDVCNFRNGTCVSNNTCSCEKGWIGTNCEIRTCFNIPESDPLVCDGHGSCEKIDSCECKSGWTSLNCSVPVCFGINSSNPQVCSNHGDCISNNTCKCKDAWFGNECQLALCGGEVSTSKAVCSSHGSCVAPNKCKCDQGWEGFNCSQPLCFNVLSGDNGVCFSHGICTDVDTCVCEPKWKGLQCSLHTCFGLEYNTTNVCHGHGSCVSVDECVCELGWSGKECLEYSCNQIPQNSSSVCSGHGTCSTLDTCTCQTGYQGKWCELYNCYGNLVQNSTLCLEKKSCSSLLNCSGHGECDYNANCVCYSNSSNGYWKNATCNECQENYFGKDCSTSLKGTVRFLDDFSGIMFNLQGNLQADQNIDCSRIIPSFEMYLFGSSKPSCNWIHSTAQFYIKFGDGFQLTPNKLIHLNMLVFDSIIGSEKLISTNVLNPLNPVRPSAQISQTRSEYGSCEEVFIDGSSSYSPDSKPLIFTWNISHISYKLYQTSNSSYVTLPTTAPSGDYSISLKVFSELSGLESQLYQVSFTKKQVSFPIVSIVGGSYSSSVVNQVPVVIGTIITLPDCISNSSNSLSYKWEKISGPELSMISNSKDLIITEFTEKSKQSYTFKLIVTSLEIVGMSTSTLAYLNTTLEPFNTILYVSDLTTDKAVIGADFTTSLDLSKETFKWSCEDTMTKGQCDGSINSALDEYSFSKSTIITIPSTKQNISLALLVRDVISTVDIVFPTSTNVAPLINLLMVNPSDRTILTSKESLNLQLSVSLNGVEDGIDSKLERLWTLNGQSIPTTYVSSMKTELSKSNYIILDSSFLQKGSDYTLEFKATNLDCGLSSFYSFKFSIAKPIPACIPKSSLSEVYALETKLTLTLPNCKLDTSLESKFYFTDPKSTAKIYLASGTQITTLLPLSELGFLNLQAVITDKSSGETSESSVSVKTLVPLGNSITEIRIKQKAWIAQANRLLPGDPQTSVLNSGTISNVVQVMISKLSSKRSSFSSCQNGILNSNTQECTCHEGYSKLDCSILTTEWIERKELMDSMATMFSNSYNSRNKYEKITDTYLLSQLFAMRNILKVFDELSAESVESILGVLGELSTNSVNNKNLQPPSGFENLLVEVVNSLYRYRKLVLKEKLTSSKMNYLMNITLEMGNVMVRNKFIGGDSLNFISEFIGITSSRLYPRDLSDYVLEQSNNTMIKLPNGMMKHLESSYSKRRSLTLRLSKTINYIEPTSKDMEILSSMVNFEVLEFPLKNISERIDFRLEVQFSPTRRTSSSKIVCAMLMNGNIWDTSVCELSRNVNSSNVADCLCSQQGTVSLLSILNSDTIPTSSSGSTNTGNLPSNNTSLEFLALLSLIVLVFIVCALITIIICCIVRKKKNKGSTPTRAKELVNV